MTKRSNYRQTHSLVGNGYEALPADAEHKNPLSKYIYIYIYIERERERDVVI
jgi:hypothetical protein